MSTCAPVSSSPRWPWRSACAASWPRRLSCTLTAVLGGFNWSLQHLQFLEVCGGLWEAAVGGSGVSRSDSVAGAADGGLAAGPGPVLGSDRGGGDDRGRRGPGGCVVAGRVPLVPSRWRGESMLARNCFGSLPIVG